MKKNYHKTRPRPLNYGWVMKHDWNYRKALRQCRVNKKRYGAAFDETEVKELFRSMCIFMEKNAFPIDKVYYVLQRVLSMQMCANAFQK